MKKISFLVSVFLMHSLWASQLPSYYPSSFVNQNSKDSELKEIIFKLLTSAHLKVEGHRDLLVESCEKSSQKEPDEDDDCYSQKKDISYKKARQWLFGHLHMEVENGDHWVKDAYCNKWVNSEDGIGPMQIPNHLVMNCEHTWPQSKFNTSFSKSLQKTDLHHLYPVDNRANSTRGNNIFAEVDGIPVNKNCASSQKGNALDAPTTEGTYAFQPPVEHRGNVARALFYFSIRYKSPIGPLQEAFLRKWHHEDPVDNFESWRNNEIMKIQGNRNPFIDEPSLVGQIQDF